MIKYNSPDVPSVELQYDGFRVVGFKNNRVQVNFHNNPNEMQAPHNTPENISQIVRFLIITVILQYA